MNDARTWILKGDVIDKGEEFVEDVMWEEVFERARDGVDEEFEEDGGHGTTLT